MYSHKRPHHLLTLALLLTVTLAPGPDARARARSSGNRGLKVLTRSYPLRMSYRMRAHIRGVSLSTFRNALLMQRLQEARSSLPGRVRLVSPRRARPNVPTLRPSAAIKGRARPRAARPAAPAPPPRPLLRAGVGYPLPPWLRGIRLPDVHVRFSPQVYRYLAYYRTSRVARAVLARWLGRMNRYKAHISAALRRHNLPQDLIYVAMIESGFRPTTVSWAGAAGLWQFIPSGARTYGLPRSFWVDERFNPERSTEAAMYYLEDLYSRFGSWELALAAYNAGYNGVARAIKKYNTNDYWRLCEYEAGLPYETMRYVPKFFAIAVVANNLERFGITPKDIAPPWEYGLVTVSGGARLSRLARLAEVPLKTLKELNPELRRGRIPPGQRYELRLPPRSMTAFKRNMARASAGAQKLSVHTVRFGDSIRSIAAAYGISPGLLRRINNIRSRREVRPGVKLLVPANRRRRSARRSIRRRIVAVVPETVRPGMRAIYYPVVAGDELPAVARALGVKLEDLVAWNAVTPMAKLLPGMVLRAFVPPDRFPRSVHLLDPSSIEVLPVNSLGFHLAHADRRHRRRIVYRVRRGDTMRRVARRFGVSRGAIARYNKIYRGARLRPGQRLVLYTRRFRRRRRHRRRRHLRQRHRRRTRSHRSSRRRIHRPRRARTGKGAGRAGAPKPPRGRRPERGVATPRTTSGR